MCLEEEEQEEGDDECCDACCRAGAIVCEAEREGPKERLRTDSELITTNEKSSQVKGASHKR